MDNSLFVQIEHKIDHDDFEGAQQLLQGIVLDEVSGHQRSRFFFLLAKTYFEREMDDLVMPTLQNVFENADEFVEIDRAYLIAAVLHVFKAEEKEGDEKHADLLQARTFFDRIRDPAKLSINEQDIYYFRRGLMELYSNRLEESIRNLETVLTINSADGDKAAVHGYLADAYKDLKDYEKAIRYYDLAIENTTPDKPNDIAFHKIDKARILDILKQPVASKKLIEEVLKEFDSGKEKENLEIAMYSQDVLGQAFYSLKDYQSSLNCYNQSLNLATKLGKDTTPYLFDISRARWALGDSKNSENIALKAIETTKNDTYKQLLHTELFHQYLHSDRYEEAIDILHQLIEKYPDCENLGWAYLMIGHMHSLLDKHREAIDFFKRSLNVLDEDDEDRLSALDFTAYCYLKLESVDKAMKICFEIIEEYPERPNLAWTHAVLARCYFEKGMKIEAREHAEKAQQYKPPESEVYSFSENVLADILKDLGIE